MVLEKTLESPLDCKEIQPVHPKGDQSWVFIGRTDAEAGTPIQDFGHLVLRADSFEKILMLEKMLINRTFLTLLWKFLQPFWKNYVVLSRKFED